MAKQKPPVPTSEKEIHHLPYRAPLLTVFLYFLRLGATAFGLTMLQKLRSDLIKRGWASREEVDAAIALDQLYPGPPNFDFVAIIGYLLHGFGGSALASLAFILPSLLVMVLLSWIYFSIGNLPWVSTLFLGLSAIVVGILANLILQLAEDALTSVLTVFFMIAAVLCQVSSVNPVFTVIGGFALGALLLRKSIPTNTGQSGLNLLPERYAWLKIGLFSAILLAILLLSIFIPGDLSKMNLLFIKTGSISFGNGATILPLLKHDVVDTHHWLTQQQFIDGIALGQITPGPILITTAFIGYKVGGLLGAISGPMAIFFPTFLMTLIALQLFTAMQKWQFLYAGLKGVLPVFVGLLTVVTFQIAQVSLVNLPAVLLAMTTFLFNRYLKVDIVWLFGGGLVLWVTLMLLGVV
jgi:chromate transporter